MGISRDSRHKRRATGGKRAIHQKKRKYELGRPASMTKLGGQRVHIVRCRGGNIKYRALRLETGNFSWPSERCAFKSKIIGVVYNATSNELVRTNTIVKNTIIAVDATPFKAWYMNRYGVDLGKKTIAVESTEPATMEDGAEDPTKAQNAQQSDATKNADSEDTKGQKAKDAKSDAKGQTAKPAKDAKVGGANPESTPAKPAKLKKVVHPLESALVEQFASGRLLACVSSRPGQSGRADGYILEGKELDFYRKKMDRKRKH